jgi:PAS domain S-box-containing protein
MTGVAMNGRTHAYLDLAALPPVGALLLESRPAMVFRGDGSAILWANAAALAFFGEPDLGALLDRRFARGGPLATHLARLAKSLPTDHDRVELFRFSFGVSQAVLSAACRRLDLGSGASAVLLAGTVAGPRESLATRAERLADAVAGADGLVAVLDRDGRVLGASGGFDALEPAAAAIDALILEAERSERRVLRRAVAVGPAVRDAGVARVAIGADRCFLLVVGPEEAAVPAPAPAKPEVETPRVAVLPEAPADVPSPVAESPPPATEPVAAHIEAPPAIISAPAEPPAAADTGAGGELPQSPAAVRFLWRTDADQVFGFVSPDLAAAVGGGNAPRPGETWPRLAARLGFDGGDRFAAALASLAAFSGVTVWWPAEGTADAVAVDLDGMPEFGRDRAFRGYRGFGSIRPDDRRPAPPPPVAAELVPEPVSVPETVAETSAAGVPVAASAEPPPAAHGPPDDDLDDVAREQIEGAPASHPPAAVDLPRDAAGKPVPSEAARSNVVHISAPPTRILPPRRLSGSEEDAFRRIAEALGARVVEEVPPDPLGKGGEAPVPTGPDTAILDRLPVGIAVYRDSRTLYANRALVDLLGYGDVAAFLAAGGVAAIFPDQERRERAAGVDAGRLDAARRDGTHVAVEAKLHAVPWSGATAMMLSLQGVPAQPAAAAEIAAEPEAVLTAADDWLIERVEELETILDTATDGVVIIERDGRIADINRAGEALFGVEGADVAGKPFTGLLAEESRKAALDYIDGLSENGVASVLNDGREVIGRVPRGGLIPLFMTIGRLGDSGKFCAVLRDITHWKNVEEELTAARRAAESANAQKSEFLAKISHEIRTPLNAIIGFSEVMMEERFGPIGSDRYRSYLRDIHLSGEHLMSLINDLLDLSKVEAGKFDLNFEAVSLNDVIRECVALMQPQANRERIIIRTSLSSVVPNVVADLRSLRQILLNLLSNAIKFTRSGGQVIVATALEESGEVVVRIRDTGIGMTAGDIETAMTPFRQVNTAGRPHEGTGLGLPLTKALVEANRASFAIDSIPNQGTLVRVTFPTTRVLAG